MPKGISNFQIKFVIKNFQDDDMMKNFVGIYFQQTIWTNLLISNQWYLKKLAISFLIAKTGSSDKDVTHWWSILSIEAKTDLFFFFFVSLGIDGLKNFIIQDHELVIQKILFGIEKMTRTDSKI